MLCLEELMVEWYSRERADHASRVEEAAKKWAEELKLSVEPPYLLCSRGDCRVPLDAHYLRMSPDEADRALAALVLMTEQQAKQSCPPENGLPFGGVVSRPFACMFDRQHPNVGFPLTLSADDGNPSGPAVRKGRARFLTALAMLNYNVHVLLTDHLMVMPPGDIVYPAQSFAQLVENPGGLLFTLPTVRAARAENGTLLYQPVLFSQCLRATIGLWNRQTGEDIRI